MMSSLIPGLLLSDILNHTEEVTSGQTQKKLLSYSTVSKHEIWIYEDFFITNSTMKKFNVPVYVVSMALVNLFKIQSSASFLSSLKNDDFYQLKSE